ncbi:TBC domain-containing protein [Cryptosporidium andersoni]|uniref:TBC domain-containing protein n=1 Tax=Cryptosporidium andersoni TaxID=117008 RepID=A0A1J4MBF0_9CRYT|nr:TBC domain-containing protein [Cryptosporidium andersoni]
MTVDNSWSETQINEIQYGRSKLENVLELPQRTKGFQTSVESDTNTTIVVDNFGLINVQSPFSRAYYDDITRENLNANLYSTLGDILEAWHHLSTQTNLQNMAILMKKVNIYIGRQEICNLLPVSIQFQRFLTGYDNPKIVHLHFTYLNSYLALSSGPISFSSLITLVFGSQDSSISHELYSLSIHDIQPLLLILSSHYLSINWNFVYESIPGLSRIQKNYINSSQIHKNQENFNSTELYSLHTPKYSIHLSSYWILRDCIFLIFAQIYQNSVKNFHDNFSETLCSLFKDLTHQKTLLLVGPKLSHLPNTNKCLYPEEQCCITSTIPILEVFIQFLKLSLDSNSFIKLILARLLGTQVEEETEETKPNKFSRNTRNLHSIRRHHIPVLNILQQVPSFNDCINLLTRGNEFLLVYPLPSLLRRFRYYIRNRKKLRLEKENIHTNSMNQSIQEDLLRGYFPRVMLRLSLDKANLVWEFISDQTHRNSNILDTNKSSKGSRWSDIWSKIARRRLVKHKIPIGNITFSYIGYPVLPDNLPLPSPFSSSSCFCCSRNKLDETTLFFRTMTIRSKDTTFRFLSTDIPTLCLKFWIATIEQLSLYEKVKKSVELKLSCKGPFESSKKDWNNIILENKQIETYSVLNRTYSNSNSDLTHNLNMNRLTFEQNRGDFEILANIDERLSRSKDSRNSLSYTSTLQDTQSNLDDLTSNFTNFQEKKRKSLTFSLDSNANYIDREHFACHNIRNSSEYSKFLDEVQNWSNLLSTSQVIQRWYEDILPNWGAHWNCGSIPVSIQDKSTHLQSTNRIKYYQTYFKYFVKRYVKISTGEISIDHLMQWFFGLHWLNQNTNLHAFGVRSKTMGLKTLSNWKAQMSDNHHASNSWHYFLYNTIGNMYPLYSLPIVDRGVRFDAPNSLVLINLWNIGIPWNLRHKIWPIALNDYRKITPELFYIWHLEAIFNLKDAKGDNRIASILMRYAVEIHNIFYKHYDEETWYSTSSFAWLFCKTCGFGQHWDGILEYDGQINTNTLIESEEYFISRDFVSVVGLNTENRNSVELGNKNFFKDVDTQTPRVDNSKIFPGTHFISTNVPTPSGPSIGFSSLETLTLTRFIQSHGTPRMSNLETNITNSTDADDKVHSLLDENPLKQTCTIAKGILDILGALLAHSPNLGFQPNLIKYIAILFIYMDTPNVFKCILNLMGSNSYLIGSQSIYCHSKEQEDTFKNPQPHVENLSTNTDYIYTYKSMSCFTSRTDRQWLLICHTFQSCVYVTFPQLYQHLIYTLDIPFESFVITWFRSIFMDILPLSTVLVVWDNFLLFGLPFLFQTGLTILKVNQAEILRCSNSLHALHALLCVSKDRFKINPQVFVEALNQIRRICDISYILSIISQFNLLEQKRWILKTQQAIKSYLINSGLYGTSTPSTPREKNTFKMSNNETINLNT